MAKRYRMYILVLVFAVLIGGIPVIAIQNNTPTIKTFEVHEYQNYLSNFSSEEKLGAISDIQDLLKKVEMIWIKNYGEHIKKEKPYQIFYDENNEIWLVQGTLRPNMMGGVANIIVEDGTGKVLAIWHDK